jgi:hypothetical protein
LRLVYRLIFLLTIEERGLLHAENTTDSARSLYAEGYGIRRLCDRSVKRSAHDRFSDLWEGTKIVFRALTAGEPTLALPALAGIFASSHCATLDAAKLENRAFLLAVFRLSWLREDTGLARVNWRDMGPEELGSVYESLLELVPQITKEGREFAFATGGETKGNARKTTSSYYTHESLVQVLLDSALEPVVRQAISAHPKDPVAAILGLSVVDPACGSGHFLLAAARRLAAHVVLLSAKGAPSASEYRHALREVVARCIYGVDLNPMAVELCKVSLWMEAVDPGLPLTFLDSHVQHGNALFGTTPELMVSGVPDAAWNPIEGDDKQTASLLKKRNKSAAAGQRGLSSLWSEPVGREAEQVARAVSELETASDIDFVALAQKESRWASILASAEYRHQKFVADAWCAAFVWPKQPGAFAEAAPTNELWRQLRDGQGQPPPLTTTTVGNLAQHEQYRFFHWNLQFPQVFAKGGFDVVLGNPPWDTLSPDRREYFAKFQPDIRSLSPAEQDAVIDRLMQDEMVAAAWERHQIDLFGLVHFLKRSGRYTLFAPGNLGKGDFNVYRMFTELALRHTRAGGYAAQVLPGGIYGGANASAIRQFMFDRCELRHLWGLINTNRRWFAHVDIDRFAAYAACRGGRTATFLAHFGLTQPADLAQPPVEVDAEFIRSNTPNTYTIPDVRSPADLTLAKKMLDAYPAFGDESAGPPRRHYQAELHMGNDTARFTTNPDGLPVYEGRMITHFDHRAKTYHSGHGNSSRWIERTFGDSEKAIVPQWRVLPVQVPKKLGNRCERYRLAFGDVANPRNERSFTAVLVPPGVICGHKVPTIVFDAAFEWAYLPWLAVANSFVMDWIARSKLSSPSMTFSLMDSLPFPRPKLTDAWVQLSAPLVLRLICTAPEMTAFWNRMAAHGLCVAVPDGTVPPSALLEEPARERAGAELHALVAQAVYGLTREELCAVLESFPVVKKRDIRDHGEYRTKCIILEYYDALAEAARIGRPYVMRSGIRSVDPSLECRGSLRDK